MALSTVLLGWADSARVFAGVPSAATGKYTPEAAAVRGSVRSGQALVLNFTQPCPPVAKADCSGWWADWGECETNGHKVVRFTVEVEAAGGGKPCAHMDGDAARHSCS